MAHEILCLLCMRSGDELFYLSICQPLARIFLSNSACADPSVWPFAPDPSPLDPVQMVADTASHYESAVVSPVSETSLFTSKLLT